MIVDAVSSSERFAYLDLDPLSDSPVVQVAHLRQPFIGDYQPLFATWQRVGKLFRADGLIRAAVYGAIEFTIPGMAAYLRDRTNCGPRPHGEGLLSTPARGRGSSRICSVEL